MIVTRRIRPTMMMMMEKEGPSMMKRRMLLKRRINHDTIREKLFPIMMRSRTIIMIIKKMTRGKSTMYIREEEVSYLGGGYLLYYDK
jgi:hypothetical protein